MENPVSDIIAGFFGRFPLRHVPRGSVLLRAGDQPESVFYVASGRIKQYDISYSGVEVVVNSFKPPAFFPMSNALNQTVNDYFFEAETDCEIHVAPATEAVAFVRANPDVLYDLLARVYRGTDGLLGRLVHLMSGTARHRVLFEIALEVKRFGQPVEGGIALAINETDLAARAGLARETVNREMHKLKAEKLLRLDRSQLVVLDVERLADLTGR